MCMQLNNAPKDWKLVSTTKMYSDYYIHLYEDVLSIRGREKTYLRGVRKDYSTIVPFVSDDEILVIEIYRHIVDSIQIEVPSGYIDGGETPKQAAIRELAEETGYTVKDVIPIGTSTPDYTMFEQKGNIFVGYGLVKEQEQSLGIMENINVATMKISEVRKLLLEGRILNAASIVALYRAISFHDGSY
jgi:ADP-ribose pyrophosphatase